MTRPDASAPVDLTVTDVSQQLGVSPATVRRLAAAATLPAYLVAHRYRFNQADIHTYLDRVRQGPPPTDPTTPLILDLSLNEAAQQLGVVSVTIRRLLTAGRLTGYQIERQYRLRQADVTAYLQSVRRGPDPGDKTTPLVLDRGITDVTQQLGLSPATVRRLAKDGTITSYQIEKQYRFRQADVIAYLDRVRVVSADESPGD